MPLTYTYPDAYLKQHVTEARETAAMADVDAIAAFSAPWREKLVILRAYLLTCLQCMSQTDDLFSAKLKSYRGEWESTLAQAKAATTDAATGQPLASFTVSLERA